MTTETVSEAERLRRVPGIWFGDEPAGRVAKVVGTGIDVWQIIGVLQDEGGDEALLAEAFHWLSPTQLRAALAYYVAFPEDIDHRLAEEALITPEWLYARYPFMRP